MASNHESNRINDDEVRIVMVGKTGTGKSATGNTILGCECFESKFSSKSMTVESTKGKATVDGHPVAVIDTPGLFDTSVKEEETKKNICQSISYASPGPHIFLVVIRLGRFTEEERQTVQKIQKIFGEDVYKYSMVLFTGGDQLGNETTIQDFLAESPDLQEIVARCNGQYHVFNNALDNTLKEHSQVTELLQKIREIVQQNGGSHYTNEMFQRAERVIEEEKQRILKEKEEKMRQEQEKIERKIQEKYQKDMQKYTKQLQAEREREREEREEERNREEERKRKEREEEMKKLEEKFARNREEERKKEEESKREEERKREERKKERKREEEKKKEEDRKREEERKSEEEKNREEMKKLKEKWERELEEEKRKIQSRYENEARDEAEAGNPVYRFFKDVFDVICSPFQKLREFLK